MTSPTNEIEPRADELRALADKLKNRAEIIAENNKAFGRRGPPWRKEAELDWKAGSAILALLSRLENTERERDNAPNDQSNTDSLYEEYKAIAARLRIEADDMRAKAVSNARERNAAEARCARLEEALCLAEKWLPCVEGHISDGPAFKADREVIRTALAQSERTP